MTVVTANERFRKASDIPCDVTRAMLKFHAIARELMFQRLSDSQLQFTCPDCHVVSRAYALVFPELEVCDGVLIISNESGLLSGQHSWLRFKRHPDFGVDVAPCGSLQFMTFPNLIYFDRYAPFHRYGQASPEISKRIETEVNEFFEILLPLAQKSGL